MRSDGRVNIWRASLDELVDEGETESSGGTDDEGGLGRRHASGRRLVRLLGTSRRGGRESYFDHGKTVRAGDGLEEQEEMAGRRVVVERASASRGPILDLELAFLLAAASILPREHSRDIL